MFVHLDLGWMDHPFPLSSFRIAAERQIEDIRALGIATVRWVPERSDPGLEPSAAPPAAVTCADEPPEHGQPMPPAESPASSPDPAKARRDSLLRQRQATRVCERQYGEATRAWRGACERVLSQPVRARDETESLTRALLDKMLGEGEACIRMLNSASGDRSSAHALNVAVMSMLMGRSLGWDEPQLMELGVGALMHDVGKVELPDRLRHLQDHFTPEELKAYRDHVPLGAAHARRMGLSPTALSVVLQHHEHADATGFPRGLALQDMTPSARIVALVNRFDTLCNPPVLARAMTPHEALSHLFTQARARYDADLLAAFIRLMGVYPAGSVVQLTDDRYAMVVSVNPARPLKPRLLVYDPDVPVDEALHVDLEQVSDLGIRRSLRPSLLPPDAKAYLAPRPRVSYFFESSSFGALNSGFDALPSPQEAAA